MPDDATRDHHVPLRSQRKTTSLTCRPDYHLPEPHFRLCNIFSEKISKKRDLFFFPLGRPFNEGVFWLGLSMVLEQTHEHSTCVFPWPLDIYTAVAQKFSGKQQELSLLDLSLPKRNTPLIVFRDAADDRDLALFRMLSRNHRSRE